MISTIKILSKKSNFKYCSVLLVVISLFCFQSYSLSKQQSSSNAKKTLQPFPLNQTLITQLKNQGGTLLSQKSGDYLIRAQNLASNKKYTKAIELLDFHSNRANTFSQTELANFDYCKAQIYREQEVSDKKNHSKSLAFFQKSLDSKALSYHLHLATLYTMAQIHIEQNNIEKATELLKLWFTVNPNPNPSAYILLASTYYQTQQIDKALIYIEHTLSMVAQPKENWLAFAVAIYFKKKNYKKAQPYLEKLVALYPDKAIHWKQLVGVYIHLNQNKKAFVTLDMAYKMNHLKTKTEFLNLASLYKDQGLPYQSAKFLETQINNKEISKERKHLDLLAEAFYLARETKQSFNYLKEIATTSTDSKFFLKYGEMLLSEEQWQEAETVLRKTLTLAESQNTIKNIQSYKKILAQQNETKLPSQNLTIQVNQKIAQTEIQPSGIQETIAISKDNSAQPKRKIAQAKTLSPPQTNDLELVYLNLGIALYNQKKYEPSLVYFKKSIEIDDTFISGYQWIDYAETNLTEQKKQAKL